MGERLMGVGGVGGRLGVHGGGREARNGVHQFVLDVVGNAVGLLDRQTGVDDNGEFRAEGVPDPAHSQVVHGQPIPAGYVALTAGYAALYTAMLLTLAVLVFSRRDFK